MQRLQTTTYPKNKRIAIYILWLFIIFSFNLKKILAQPTTKINGVVYDAVTKVPQPFVNILVKGSTTGTITDTEGKFSLLTQKKADTLIISSLGFRKQYIRLKPGEMNSLEIYLEPDNQTLNSVTIKYDGNPAERLIKKVIKHKPENNPEELNTLQYNVYQKIEVDVYNIPKGLKNNVLLKPFDFMWTYMDSTGSDGKKYLPSFITESYSRMYRKKVPAISKEYILASRIAGNENENVSQFTGDFYQNINIYRDYLVIAGKTFVSPIAANGIFFYNYYLSDSTFRDGKKLYYMEFFPRRKQEYTFNGNMWIHDTTFAVESVQLELSENVNVNFIQKFYAAQYFKQQADNRWLPLRDSVYVDFAPLTRKAIAILGRKKGFYENYVIDAPIPDSVIRNPNNIVVIEGAVEKKEAYWDTVRLEVLNQREEGIYEMVDSVKNTPRYKTYRVLGGLFTTGYLQVKRFEIGQFYKFYSWNPVEGNRIKFGGRTSLSMSKRWFADAYIAYGFLDRQIKYKTSFYWHFDRSRNPWRLFGISYRNDMEQFAYDTEGGWDHDNIIQTIFRRQAMKNLLYSKEFKVFYEHEWFSGLLTRVGFSHKDLSGTNYFRFQSGADSTRYFNTLTTTEFTFYGRFAFREKYIVRRIDRTPTGTRFPVLEVNFSAGIKDLWDGDFTYQRLVVNVYDRIRMGPVGFLDYWAEGGKVWGAVPWPYLFNHNGNPTYIFSRSSFNNMLSPEFVSDEYATLYVEWHLDGLLFNRIPGFRKLKWREVIHARGLWGSLKNYDKHASYIRFPSYSETAHIRPSLLEPYYEVGFGIENIFRIFRVDFIWRLTNLQNDYNGDGIVDKKIKPFQFKLGFGFRL